ncbi:MAG: hypothetical protein JW779_16045 [Candidatus Thorarchaeota archaeon]|nr:hypothetical protein [Candidatus Thorarchaeota archaeon]
MNYGKILSISAIVIVVIIVITILLSMNTITGANAALLISEYQMIVIALGLSAIVLAILRLSYGND